MLRLIRIALTHFCAVALHEFIKSLMSGCVVGAESGISVHMQGLSGSSQPRLGGRSLPCNSEEELLHYSVPMRIHHPQLEDSPIADKLLTSSGVWPLLTVARPQMAMEHDIDVEVALR